MALENTKRKVQPIGWPVNTGAPVNFDNPIPTNDWNSGAAPIGILPKPQANPLGGFSNPKMPYVAPKKPIVNPAPIGITPTAAAGLPPQPAAQLYNPDPARIDKMRKPLPVTSSTIPNIDATAGEVQPGGGTMSVQGGGSATIDAQGNINRDAAFNAANRADAIKNHGGIGGTLNVMAPETNTPITGTAQPIGGDKWSFLEDGSAFGAAKAGVARKLGYVPTDYDQNSKRYDAMITSQGANYAQAENDIPVAQINAEAHKYTADQGLTGNLATAGSHVQAAEIGAEGNKRRAIAESGLKVQENEQKNAKDMQKTYYDSIKGLTLPAGWEGKHMEIAKTLAQDQDPNVDLGIFYAPGQNRAGIAAKKSVFEPLLSKYLQAGLPAADAHANAYRDLQEIEKQKGVSLHKPFPNIDQLYKNERKPADVLALGE